MKKTTAWEKIRREYKKSSLNWEAFPHDPLPICKQWLHDAIEQQLPDPNAMVVATTTADGQPQCRIVLLKDLDEAGFSFYTNYESAKAKALNSNKKASLLFYWTALERQLRVEGLVEQLPHKVSDAYFASRPRGAQIAAWASKQSQRLQSHQELEESYKHYEMQFAAEKHVPRPPAWGGYLLRPQCIEFWQGRESRLHDRICYERSNNTEWKHHWLAP